MKFVTEETEEKETVIAWRVYVDDMGDACLQCRGSNSGGAWINMLWVRKDDGELMRPRLDSNPANLPKDDDDKLKLHVVD
ncbi:MAG TPA: hypothetical protein ENH82_19715 [bacterium]|nr:hypothetical protein [bacterium]